MLNPMQRARAPECIGDLRFDQWRAGELSPPDEAKLTRHVAACPRCRARQALHEQARERFEATVAPAPEWPARPEPERRRFSWRRLLLRLGVLLALAASGFVALQLRGPSALRLPGFLFLRSGSLPFVSFYVERGRELQRGANAELLYPGEHLRFAYTTANTQHLAILSLDNAGRASVYYPRAARRAARVAPGRDVLLDERVTLDAGLGETSIVAVFCERVFDVEPMRVALETEWSSLRAPAACSTQELHVTKRSGPP